MWCIKKSYTIYEVETNTYYYTFFTTSFGLYSLINLRVSLQGMFIGGGTSSDIYEEDRFVFPS